MAAEADLPAGMRPIGDWPAAARRAIRFVLLDIDDTLTTDGRLTAAAYAALERLSKRGFRVIPVTGRPGGWCDLIARFWPVDAVVGENGAFWFRYDRERRSMTRRFWLSEPERITARERLERLGRDILAAMPAARVAADQPYRVADLAIDYREDAGPLPAEDVDRIVAIMHAAGATAKVSSIHVNGWFGDWDKLAMTRRLFTELYGFDLDRYPEQVAFIGDSPNDEPMFACFPNSVAVANIRPYVPRLGALPAYVTEAEAGAGFVEFAEALLGVSEIFDLLVIGGGINGAGIARDAAGRGLNVLLCDKGDLAGATSSASSKLIHGGLRYLEHGDFRLVREGLAEREVLLRMAPHLVRPLSFVLPQGPGSRPAWLVRAGLFLYDRLGGARSLPGTRSVAFREDPLGEPLHDAVRSGFVYTDCGTDDARLTIATARDAAIRGAEILPRTELVSARRQGRNWQAKLRGEDGELREVAARILVNAAGPWAVDVLARAGLAARATLRLVKGSHIVVPRLYEGEHAYLLQNEDRRIVFVIPFEREFSLIGTTELPFAGDAAVAEISQEEIAYLCRAVARWFGMPPTPAGVVWSYAGVRPLHENRAKSAAAVSRDYAFELDTTDTPALSIFGGKLTTYRRLAEHALARLAAYLPGAGPAWTAGSVLPGGEALPEGGAAGLARELGREYPFLGEMTAERLARSYGGDARRILGDARRAADLGRDFGQGFSEVELRWLVENEWGRSAEDVLWRRTKLGLRFGPAEAQGIADYLAGVTRSVPTPVDAANPQGARTACR